VQDVSVAPDDRALVTCGGNDVCVWDLETTTLLRRMDSAHGEGGVCAAQWHGSHTDRLLTCGGDKMIKLWDPRVPKTEEACVAIVRDAHYDVVSRVAWSPLRQDWFATTSHDGNTKVFDARNLKSSLIVHQAGRERMTALTWHPTVDHLLLTASQSGNMHHWIVDQASTCGHVSKAHDKAIQRVVWNPTGNLLVSVSLDGITRFWARNRPGDELADKYNLGALPHTFTSASTFRGGYRGQSAR
jgi:polyadenylation factor subunit 2